MGMIAFPDDCIFNEIKLRILNRQILICLFFYTLQTITFSSKLKLWEF